ncbi:MAG: flagellar biosynthesis protein FlhB [Phycisphaerales bacterium]|nr:flagellar biosynthesis protein FlhB [Phycisphaerales bacterium]
MAGEYGEKTEAPTPRRRRESREKGQVAKSQDLTPAVIMLVGLVTLRTLGPHLWNRLLGIMNASLEVTGPVGAQELAPQASAAARAMMWTLIPLLIAVFIAALVALYWQVGFLFTWHPVKPDLNKINPLSGVKRMFSVRTFMMSFINFAKVLVLIGVVYWSVAGSLGHIIYAMQMHHVEVYAMIAVELLRLGTRLAVVMVLLALLDYVYQRYRHEKDLKMSKEEVREEMKHMEGDPTMKRRRREVQMKLAMQRIQRDVPKADVIVTNPTHLAIAMRYRPDEMSAPRVVAKGADLMAIRIRQVAAAHRVPIVERRELARMMYDAVEVGQEIPERFYEAIAEVLAYVYELSGRNLRPQPVAV